MYKKVSIGEIEKIKGRLKSELKDGNSPLHRKTEVEALFYRLDTWLQWKEGEDRRRYKEQLQSES
ncbi:hypothetical protein ES708_18708 [subsurface metagenome]